MAGGLMPARRWSAQGELLHQADFVPPAPIDERGCRRDIRSNGWIVTLESVRAFESGPDVFADALVLPHGRMVPDLFSRNSWLDRPRLSLSPSRGLPRLASPCL